MTTSTAAEQRLFRRRLLGRKGIERKDAPETGFPVHGGGIGYHRRHGAHGLTPLDWKLVMDFADAGWRVEASE